MPPLVEFSRRVILTTNLLQDPMREGGGGDHTRRKKRELLLLYPEKYENIEFVVLGRNWTAYTGITEQQKSNKAKQSCYKHDEQNNESRCREGGLQTGQTLHMLAVPCTRRMKHGTSGDRVCRVSRVSWRRFLANETRDFLAGKKTKKNKNVLATTWVCCPFNIMDLSMDHTRTNIMLCVPTSSLAV